MRKPTNHPRSKGERVQGPNALLGIETKSQVETIRTRTKDIPRGSKAIVIKTMVCTITIVIIPMNRNLELNLNCMTRMGIDHSNPVAQTFPLGTKTIAVTTTGINTKRNVTTATVVEIVIIMNVNVITTPTRVIGVLILLLSVMMMNTAVEKKGENVDATYAVRIAAGAYLARRHYVLQRPFCLWLSSKKEKECGKRNDSGKENLTSGWDLDRISKIYNLYCFFQLTALNK